MKKCKIIKISILILFLLFILSSRVFALGDWFTQAEGFIGDGKGQADAGNAIDSKQLDEGSDMIFNALLAVGTVVAVIVGAILGLQFMTAGIDKKVEVKQALFPYIVSCVILFGAFGIWKLTVTIMNEVTPSGSPTVVHHGGGGGKF